MFAVLFVMAVIAGVSAYAYYTVQQRISNLATKTDTQFVDAKAESVRTKALIDSAHTAQLTKSIESAKTITDGAIASASKALETTHTNDTKALRSNITDIQGNLSTMHEEVNAGFKASGLRMDNLNSALLSTGTRIDVNTAKISELRGDFDTLQTSHTSLSTKMDNRFTDVNTAFTGLSDGFNTFTTKTYPTQQNQLKDDLLASQSLAVQKLKAEMTASLETQSSVISTLQNNMSDKFAAIDAIDVMQDQYSTGLQSITDNLNLNLNNTRTLMHKEIVDSAASIQLQIDGLLKRVDSTTAAYTDLSAKLAQNISSDSAAMTDLRNSTSQMSASVVALQGQLQQLSSDLSSYKTLQASADATTGGQITTFQNSLTDYNVQLKTVQTLAATVSKQQSDLAVSIQKQIDSVIASLTSGSLSKTAPATIGDVQAIDLKISTYQTMTNQSQTLQDGKLQTLGDQLTSLSQVVQNSSKMLNDQVVQLQVQISAVQASLKTQGDNMMALINTQGSQIVALQKQVDGLAA